MKDYIFTELGYFTDSEIKGIAERMNGKSSMHFEVGSSNYAGNHTLIVRTDYDDTEEEIKRFFLHVAMSELARR